MNEFTMFFVKENGKVSIESIPHERIYKTQEEFSKDFEEFKLTGIKPWEKNREFGK